ncbi:splicing factor, arginine/serine-rich 19-like [Penaeus japonicus]|uniref:splicing factor, arginine/serine-rich 19-like n=1 Tax=Penaeus japonicus TaxID=27405 RepID=UPI001C71262B|nr:splicing factor, arginine/serine-rich 19-like [Penaeus japonicus]
MEQDFPWTEEQTFCFIQARARLKTSSNGTPDYLYQSVIDELGLTGQISPAQARRHWDSLVTRYKELSQPALEPEDAAPPSWPFYAAMQDVLLTMPPSVLPMSDSQEMEEPGVEGNGNGIDRTFHQGQSVEDIEEEYEDEEEEEDEEEDEDEEEEEEDEDDGMMDEDEDHLGDGFDDEDSQDISESQVDDNSQEMDSLEVDEVWTEPRIFRFIELRGAKEADMVALGPSPVFAEILEELGMSEEVTPAQARKKWTQLVRRYLEFKGPYGESGRPIFTANPSMITPDLNDGGWLFYSSMHAVMEAIKATSPDGGTKTRKSPEYTWSVDVTRKFIKIRGEKHAEISQKGHNAVYQ